MENNQKLLLFGIKKEKEKLIRDLCKTLQISVLIIPHDKYGQPLGALAQVPGFAAAALTFPNPAFQQKEAAFPLGTEPQLLIEMLVFSGISSELLDTFLKKYREAGIPPTPLKAVLTPHNASWNVYQLHAELFREHTALLP